ncbi:MAG TPA: DUF2480 family protein [Cyclobacteriaceae bacterium]|nr:DUF2480 family protein [Cyclobacteriaceae bacterium]
MSEIVNRVAKSPIVTIDLEEFYVEGERLSFDLGEHLYQGLVLREKDFRESLKNLDWEIYRDKLVAVYCSVDAIVPSWAYMLVMTYLQGVAREVVVGDLAALDQFLFQKSLQAIDPADYCDRPVVVKGCSKRSVPLYAYGEVVKILMGSARSIMYGEPCSTVPIYKKPKPVKQ